MDFNLSKEQIDTYLNKLYEHIKEGLILYDDIHGVDLGNKFEVRYEDEAAGKTYKFEYFKQKGIEGSAFIFLRNSEGRSIIELNDRTKDFIFSFEALENSVYNANLKNSAISMLFLPLAVKKASSYEIDPETQSKFDTATEFRSKIISDAYGFIANKGLLNNKDIEKLLLSEEGSERESSLLSEYSNFLEIISKLHGELFAKNRKQKIVDGLEPEILKMLGIETSKNILPEQATEPIPNNTEAEKPLQEIILERYKTNLSNFLGL